GGMESMLSTVALIMCALAFGGVMETTGMLSAIARAILQRAKRQGSLVASTVLTCIGMNIIAPDQYLAIVVPGRMYREAYQGAGLKMKNLSRALEDGGTLSSALVPWNTCGAYMWATLGVHPFAYLPFAFLNLLNPMISILLGYTGWTMEKEKDFSVAGD
ncbi:Na+/H+ antiporter NhaC, partial [candidate division KSB1 bacterium]